MSNLTILNFTDVINSETNEHVDENNAHNNDKDDNQGNYNWLELKTLPGFCTE